MHRVATQVGLAFSHRDTVDQDAQPSDAGDSQHVRTIDPSAVPSPHHHLRVRQVHGRGQVVPPGDDAGWEPRIAHHRAVGGPYLHANAGLAAHRIMETSVGRGGDGRAGDAALMDADIGVQSFAQRKRELGSGDRENADAAASLCLRLDRIGADERQPLDAAASDGEQPARVREQDEGSTGDPAQQSRVDKRPGTGNSILVRIPIDRPVQGPHATCEPNQSRDLVVDVGLGHPAGPDVRHQLITPRSVRPGHDEVEAGLRAGGGRVRGRPVGNHDATECPLCLQQVVEQ